MCCPGCAAVASAIVEAGLADYYRHRTELPEKPGELIPEALKQLELYDRPELQRSFVQDEGAHIHEAALMLEGITCAACVWLNERHVGALPGVLSFQVNYSTRRARVRWDDREIRLSRILQAVGDIGYVAHPFDAQAQERLYKKERGAALRRLAVAGVGSMQVMMLAVALWLGEDGSMGEDLRDFMRWVALLLATPVVFYSGWGFFASAWRDLRHRQLGMDVPVALAVGSTYAASAWATITGGGEVYFESACMFVFFLLTSRFLEMGARQRAGQAVEAMGRLLPALATRLDASGAEEVVAVADLAPGDRVLIRPGESIPADGLVLEGRSSVDEALLSGESLPRARAAGDALVGGTVNVDSPLVMRVDRVGPDTVVAGIQRLLDRAQTEKPRIGRLAEQGTGAFVLVVLVIAALAGLVWWTIDPTKAFWVSVAVLVVSCPCALALATPVALTATTGYLTRLGILTTRGHALEGLAAATDLVFDKTGTLTEGRLELDAVLPLGRLDEAACRGLAAGLERGSEHPVGRALRRAGPPAPVDEIEARPGSGVQGRSGDAAYRLGNLAFVTQALPAGAPGLEAARAAITVRPAATSVLLADATGVLAVFHLTDRLRPEAAEAVARLRAEGLRLRLLSGDAQAPVAEVAGRLGIEDARAGLLPEGKLALLESWQREGGVVAMVGDGINDAPVLSRAHVSVAMASGTQLAHASADMILHSDDLRHLPEAVERARATLRIIKQNIGWALGYNILALPIAAAGWLSPWLAALGMSLSSLLVVVNALRLTRSPRAGRAAP
jgi:Cu2+-exporting ATPase